MNDTFQASVFQVPDVSGSIGEILLCLGEKKEDIWLN